MSGEPVVIKRGDLILPISHPAPGASGKTGTWRVIKPVLDESKCIKCLLCWLYCPEGTIMRRSDNMVYIDYEYCKGCGICATECPTKAIKMIEEEGEEP